MLLVSNIPTLQDLPATPPGKTGWPWTEQSKPLPAKMPNGSDWPRISIVTPSYNQGEFIEKTIRSILLQGYPNLEYIILDGGSTDRTVEIIRKYEPWLDYWVSEPDKGQSDAINKGFSRTSGQILAWLNSDDYYLPQALETAGSYQWQENIGAIVGIGHGVDIKGKISKTIQSPELNFTAFLDWMDYSNFSQPSCFFTKKAWQECGPLDVERNYCMDVKLWLDISKKYKFAPINQSLSHALVHQGSKTIGQGQYSRAETILLLAEYGGEEIAKKELFDLMDMLTHYLLLKKRIQKNPLVKYFLMPIYRKFHN
ncbi:conserved hypothetical protein [Hyella patelloides LEGE 07179]|uniref:Glycosyltransferase 2-like domain-containing protein n=1 Tax=Hyella patelloides LEGE 07179 TaxID=945734 RepID=A0A563VLE5_9CYAN|nr:glycosyltransferase family 2 protein [Hyella patelloides]VEP12241.1 conserved hypothetical protein [Hyella patelloides LEGE 07179]